LFTVCVLQYDELEGVLRDSGVLAQTEKAEHLEVSLIQSMCGNWIVSQNSQANKHGRLAWQTFDNTLSNLFIAQMVFFFFMASASKNVHIRAVKQFKEIKLINTFTAITKIGLQSTAIHSTS